MDWCLSLKRLPFLNFWWVLRFNAPVRRVERRDPVVKHFEKGISDGHQSEIADWQVERHDSAGS